MTSGIILLILSFCVLIIAYQALRYKRLYWFAPTITGFRSRKKDIESKGLSRFTGWLSLIFGLWLLFLSLRFFVQKI